VSLLEKLKVHSYKIASFDLTNLFLLREVARTGKPIILSTGMSSLAEIEEALNEIIRYNDKVILLHCVSSYPSNPEGMNIRAIDTLKAAFKLPVGLSDHSLGYSIALAAAARGANVIEKHFTINREMEGPDHVVSLEPQEMKEMVSQIRIIESSLGDGIKQQLPSEFSAMLRFKKSIYACRRIKKGQKVSSGDIVLKGPAFGISPRFMEIVIGMRANEDIELDVPITWESLG
jgi:sialic acid synthase SpsE